MHLHLGLALCYLLFGLFIYKPFSFYIAYPFDNQILQRL